MCPHGVEMLLEAAAADNHQGGSVVLRRRPVVEQFLSNTDFEVPLIEFGSDRT